MSVMGTSRWWGSAPTLLLTVVLLAAGCRTAPPPRSSAAREGRDVPITDPVRWKKARQLSNSGNRAFVRGNFAEALRLARESLEAHESFGGHYLQGSALFRLGRGSESLESYYRAEAIRPTDEQLLMTIAVVELSRGDVPRALERYRRLHAEHPKDPTYAFKVGTTLKLLGRYEEAYEHLKKADQAGFTHLALVCVQLGDTALELKKYEEGEGYFARAYKLDPKLKAAGAGTKATAVARLLDQGSVAFKAGRFEEALGHYNRAKEQAPTSAGPFLLSGITLISLKKYPEAIEDLKKAVNLNPASPRGYSQLGSAYHLAGRLRDAESTFRLGLRVAPENAPLFNKLGLVLRDNGQLRAAIDAFTQAVRLKPDLTAARVNLAFALLDDKRYREAEQHLEEAARQRPADKELAESRQLVRVYAVVDQGDRYFRQGQVDRAMAEYRKALEIKKAATVYNAMGNAELARGEKRVAISHFEAARKLEPKNVPALQGLARAYSDRRDASKRAAVLAQLKRLGGSDLSVGVSLGRLREDEGKFTEAEQIYLGLLKNYKESDLVRRRLGFVYYRMGLQENDAQRFEKARERMQAAARYNPDIPQLPDSLKTIEENLRFRDQLPILRRAETLFDARRYADALPLYEQVYAKMKRPLVLIKIANCYIAMGQESRGLRLLEQSQRGVDTDVSYSEAIYSYLMQKGRVEEAARGFAQIVRTRPDSYYSHFKLGMIELMAGRLDEAQGYFNRAVTYRPDFTPAYIARGVVHYRKGNASEARREFALAQEREPKSALAAFNLGVMAFNDNLADKAEAAFAALIKTNPEFTDARYHLSYIYYARGDLDKAEQELQACIAADPQSRYRFALTQVYEKRYAASRTPANAAALRKSYEVLMVQAPGSRYAAEGREKLRRLNPDQRVLHAYPEKSRTQPIYANGVLVRVVGSEVVAHDASSKSRLWSRDFSAGVDALQAGGAVLVASGRTLSAWNHRSGQALWERELPQKAEAILGSYEETGVVVRRRIGSANIRALIVWRDGRPFEINGQAESRFFYAAGRFYHVRPGAGGSWEMERLDRELKSPGAAVGLGAARGAPQIAADAERTYVFFSGSGLFVVEGGAARRVAVKAAEERLLFAEGASSVLLLAGRDRVRVIGPDGRQVAESALQTPMSDTASATAIDTNRVLYHGTDGRLHLVELANGSAKVVWSQELGELEPAAATDGRSFSVYY